MNTKQILTGIPSTRKDSKTYSDKPMKKDDILWMLFDRDWAEHLLADKTLIN